MEKLKEWGLPRTVKEITAFERDGRDGKQVVTLTKGRKESESVTLEGQ